MEKQMNPNDLSTIDSSYYLTGLISSFDNRLQAFADNVFQEISWKQSLFINVIAFSENSPTIREVAKTVGCSHQNATKILKRLETLEFITFLRDPEDKRKQRILLTDRAQAFRKKYNQLSLDLIKELFTDVDRDEMKTTIKVITQLSENIGKMGGDTNDEE